MDVWDEAFKREEFQWKNPHERVIEFAVLLKERGAHRVLDLGCGAGRHLVYLAREGFAMYGVDISGNGLAYARRRLEQEGLEAELVESDMAQIPYRGRFFDAVISTHVIQHQTLQGTSRTTSEIRRVLRPGGLTFLTFPTRRDHRYGQGKEIEPNTFVAEVGPDRGVPHHYSNLAEIEQLLEGFVIRRVELEERSVEQEHKYSHWNVLAEI